MKKIKPEAKRLAEDATREKNWKRWGPYLAERQWGTIREDYSVDGSCWTYFPHDHARSRAYRWGEDGLLGITDRECRLCFALALWNGRDPILKERLFGLTNPEGNHGEDVKECYFYLDSSPTHSYMKALYKYPHAAFPYRQLIEENRRRGRAEPEFEITDTGVFDENRYFDVFAEYAKAAPDDLLIRLTIANRSTDAAPLHLLPTLWFRNTWAWGRDSEGYFARPQLARTADTQLRAEHETLGRFYFEIEPIADQSAPPVLLFTDNETNLRRLYEAENTTSYVKDAFHEYVVNGREDAVNPDQVGTKAAAYFRLEVAPQSQVTVRLRLSAEGVNRKRPFGKNFDETFQQRIVEMNEFYHALLPSSDFSETSTQKRLVTRQAYAGLLWSKQFYYYVVEEWQQGDPAQPPPPRNRLVRNRDWGNLFNRDVLSMPDKWEYPWYASWDLAFHTVALAAVDPDFAKSQLVLLLREWYMHPNGQIPAYEFNFSDVNPPVHAWAAWRIYKITERRGARDRLFLERVFQKLLLNFTWWVNRKDVEGNHIFAGGFLGLDNIGIIDRSQPLPTGSHLDQADGTAWMAFYCATMLAMALELAEQDHAYEDVASKFFEHFIAIVDAMNTLGGTGLWDDEDGFYYDEIKSTEMSFPLRIRSMVGLIPLFAVEVLEEDVIKRLPGFSRRMHWLLKNREDLASYISYMQPKTAGAHEHRLLAIPSRERLTSVLAYMLDENEFLSPYGIRSLSRVHLEHPFECQLNGKQMRISYEPGESTTALFGGNSNWRGPIWFPLNYLLVESLERYHHFYGDDFRVECPVGSGQMLTLIEVAREISKRLSSIFLRDSTGRSAWQGTEQRFADDPHWRNLVLFHEYFHGDTGRGLGASHQTGWTALVARLLENQNR